MKTLITGMNGTVAPALAQALKDAGCRVVAWDRTVHPIDNPVAVGDFIRGEQPDMFCHLATGSPDWAEWAARTCCEAGIRFLFTSSVSVFSAAQQGPFSVDVPPTPDDDYGRYKLACEQRVRVACPDALIVRLGWQIGEAPGKNHMVEYLERTFQEEEAIAASIHWYPACSFLADTADSLRYMLEELPAGLYHLDANPGLSFFDIVSGLNALRGEPWVVTADGAHVQNNRMIDSRVAVRSLSEHFRNTSVG